MLLRFLIISGLDGTRKSKTLQTGLKSSVLGQVGPSEVPVRSQFSRLEAGEAPFSGSRVIKVIKIDHTACVDSPGYPVYCLTPPDRRDPDFDL